jgi:hypothetical protein
MQTEPTARVSVFAISAPQDQTLQNELKEHLKPLQREGLIELWHERHMSAQTEGEQQINEDVNTAQIILLLISVDFMNSDSCYHREMPRALERLKAREALVIPILLRPVSWQGAPFSKLQMLPTNGRPITNWRDREEAWEDVVRGLRHAVDLLH